MQFHTVHQLGAPSNMTSSPSVWQSSSDTTSPEIVETMTSEISSSPQQPFSQYTIDALSTGDLLCSTSMAGIKSSSSPPNIFDLHLFKQDQQIMDQILIIVMNQYAQEQMAIVDPLTATQHIITFQLRPAVLNEYANKKDDNDGQNDEEVDDDNDSNDRCHDIHQYPTPIQSNGVTRNVLKKNQAFRQYQHGDSKYKQRECRLYHIVVDLERNIYYKYEVISINAPYDVIEHKERGYLLDKAADLYPTITNSMQFIYTSMMGMVHLDAVVINNNGEKSNKRIMGISDLVSFVSACFGIPLQSQDLYKLKVEADVKIEIDWDYIRYIAATYGKSVSDSFEKLVSDAVADHDSNDKPPSHPSPSGIIESSSSYHIQPEEIDSLLEMSGISSEGIDDVYNHQTENEEGKEDEGMKPNENEVNNDNPAAHDENDIDTILAMLDEMHAQNGMILNRLNQWQRAQKQEEPDPYMQPYDFPEDGQVMKNE